MTDQNYDHEGEAARLSREIQDLDKQRDKKIILRGEVIQAGFDAGKTATPFSVRMHVSSPRVFQMVRQAERARDALESSG